MTADELKQLREKRLGMTQQQLADALHQSWITISRWENSKKDDAVPPESASLLECLSALLDETRTRGASMTEKEVLDAIRAAGIAAVIARAATLGFLSKEIIAKLVASDRKWLWVAAVAGGGVMGAVMGGAAFLPFFSKPKQKRKE